MRDIVLVHSNNKLNDLYNQRLSRMFRVKSANNGLAGLRLVRNFNPHMVMTEFDLPLLSGLGILQFVRGQQHLRHIPVLILSHKDPEPEALNLGANEWIKVQNHTVDEVVDKVVKHLIENKIIN